MTLHAARSFPVFTDGFWQAMPANARIIGAARSEMDDAGFRDLVRGAIEEFVDAPKRDTAQIEAFLGAMHYVPIDATGEGGWKILKKRSCGRM